MTLFTHKMTSILSSGKKVLVKMQSNENSQILLVAVNVAIVIFIIKLTMPMKKSTNYTLFYKTIFIHLNNLLGVTLHKG